MQANSTQDPPLESKSSTESTEGIARSDTGSQKIARGVQEDGINWDGALKLYNHGQININFDNNVIGYTAGDLIRGTADVVIVKPFQSDNFTISLVGCERLHMPVAVNLIKEFHREVHEVVRIDKEIVKYQPESEGQGYALPPGHYTFPFEIQLPEWLPESTFVSDEGNQFLVEYTVRAQFTPYLPSDFVIDKRFPRRFDKISLFRGSRKLFVYHKVRPAPAVEMMDMIKCELGGFMGFGTQTCMAEVKLTQNQFYPGESINVTVRCDNSQCKLDVKSFKFKLYRQLWYKDPANGQIKNHESLVFNIKEDGCKAKSKMAKMFKVNIPSHFTENNVAMEAPSDMRQSVVNVNNVRQPKAALNNDLSDEDKEKTEVQWETTGSWLGTGFTVNYQLGVYVKHDSWSVIGKGTSVLFPIRIIQAPRIGQVTDELSRVPADWNPTPACHLQRLMMDPTETSTFFKKVYFFSWKGWYKNSGIKNYKEILDEFHGGLFINNAPKDPAKVAHHQEKARKLKEKQEKEKAAAAALAAGNFAPGQTGDQPQTQWEQELNAVNQNMGNMNLQDNQSSQQPQSTQDLINDPFGSVTPSQTESQQYSSSAATSDSTAGVQPQEQYDQNQGAQQQQQQQQQYDQAQYDQQYADYYNNQGNYDQNQGYDQNYNYNDQHQQQTTGAYDQNNTNNYGDYNQNQGYDQTGYDQTAYDQNAYNQNQGYDQTAYDQTGYNQATGSYDQTAYDQQYNAQDYTQQQQDAYGNYSNQQYDQNYSNNYDYSAQQNTSNPYGGTYDPVTGTYTYDSANYDNSAASSAPLSYADQQKLAAYYVEHPEQNPNNHAAQAEAQNQNYQ